MSDAVTDAPTRSASPPWLWVALVALALLPTAHRFRNRFVWDDVYVIERGTVVHSPRNLPAIFARRMMFASSAETDGRATPIDTYRPVTLSSFVLDAAIAGRSPWMYHLTGALVHCGVVLLLWRLARRLLPERDRDLAPWAGAIFALQPQLAEAHVYISGRGDTLCTLFGLGAILAWRNAHDARSQQASDAPVHRALGLEALAAALWLLGLLSKEALVGALPALALWPGDGPIARRARALAPFAFALVAYCALRLWALGGARAGYGAAQWAHSFARLGLLWLDALAELTLPTRVHLRLLFEAYRGATATHLTLAWLGALGVIAGAWALRRRLPALPYTLALFAGPLVPVAAIASMDWLGFGRYLYLPATGFALAATLAIGFARSALAEHSFARVRGIIAVWLLILGAKLAVWTGDFRDEESLYAATIHDAEGSSVGYGYLGMTLFERGDCARALPLLARARQLEPRARKYWIGLGHCELRMGYLPQARRTAAIAERAFPGQPQVQAMVSAVRRASDPGRR
jgi:hypothetical protein